MAAACEIRCLSKQSWICYQCPMTKDQVFHKKMEVIKQFQFDELVAEAFDDMVSRSVPFYDEIHRILLDVLNRFSKPDQLVYDLGCSTGTTIKMASEFLSQHDKKTRFIGVDSSAPMLQKCREKLDAANIQNFELLEEDIEKLELEDCDFVIMNYTLQFLPVAKRKEVLSRIYRALKPGGVLFLSEKVKTDNPTFDELYVDLYYDFKRRNGYSELEISQKREALENVLIPLTPKQQIKQLKASGFERSEMLFRWYNFCCYLGVK